MHSQHVGRDLKLQNLAAIVAILCLILLVVGQPARAANDESKDDSEESFLEAMEFRNIGPFRGGQPGKTSPTGASRWDPSAP